MGQFSFVQNEHYGVGDKLVSPASITGYWQGKAADCRRPTLLIRSWELGAARSLEGVSGPANNGFDTISGYPKQCGGRRFAGIAQTMRRALSIGDLPLVIAGSGRDELLCGEGWAGGDVRASLSEVCAGLPGLGGYIGRRNDAGCTVDPDEAKEIDCYA